MITRRRAIYSKGNLPLYIPLKTNVHTQLAGHNLGKIQGHTVKFHSHFTFIMMLLRDFERDCSSDPIKLQSKYFRAMT